VLQTTTDDNRLQQPLLVWPPTLCVGGLVVKVRIKKKQELKPPKERHLVKDNMTD